MQISTSNPMDSINAEIEDNIAIPPPNPPEQESADSSKKEDSQTKSWLEQNVARKFSTILGYLGEHLLSLQRFLQNRHWLLCVHSERSTGTRAYQVWPGNNVFFFHGRLVCGPDPKGLLLTTISIILSTWIFAIYIGDDLGNHSSIIVAFPVILAIVILLNLALVSAIDPGIIPRNDEAAINEIGSSQGINRRKRVIIDGVELRLKYCRICKIFRPPRSCHCAICNNCVEKFDHHCLWIGQCIALRNYKFFLMSILSALVFFIYIFVFSCWRLHHRMLKDGIGVSGMLRNWPETLALVLFSFAAIWFLGGLAVFHCYLIATNQTAYENFRECYVGSQNPYDKGVVSNVKEVLFMALPPSRVDFRAEVTEIWQ